MSSRTHIPTQHPGRVPCLQASLWIGKDSCKDPIPVGSSRANQVMLSQAPAVPLALCFPTKGMQGPLQVHICSEGQHRMLTLRSLPGSHIVQHRGVASEPTNPCLPTTPPSGAPQSAMNRSHNPQQGLQSLQPFLLFSCSSERISSARKHGAATGTRVEDSQGLHRRSSWHPKLCSLSKAPTPRRGED